MRQHRFALRSVCPEKTFTKRELIEIGWVLNQWRWDDRLGPVPEPYMRPGSKDEILAVIMPIIHEITRITGHYAQSRYHNVEMGGKSRWEFLRWYISPSAVRLRSHELTAKRVFKEFNSDADRKGGHP